MLQSTNTYTYLQALRDIAKVREGRIDLDLVRDYELLREVIEAAELLFVGVGVDELVVLLDRVKVQGHHRVRLGPEAGTKGSLAPIVDLVGEAELGLLDGIVDLGEHHGILARVLLGCRLHEGLELPLGHAHLIVYWVIRIVGLGFVSWLRLLGLG
jgi:hypothetical protein